MNKFVAFALAIMCMTATLNAVSPQASTVDKKLSLMATSSTTEDENVNWVWMASGYSKVTIANKNLAYAIKTDGKLYEWNGVNWFNIPTGNWNIKDVSVAQDGTVWATSTGDGIFTLNVCSDTWNQIDGALKQVGTSNANSLWGTNSVDDIFYRVFSQNKWVQAPGKLIHVSIGSDDTVWGVNSADNIYKWNGSNWDYIDGALVQVSVGNANNVWGVNRSDQIWRRNGSSWVKLNGALTWVSVNKDGLVMGVNRNGELYRNF